MDHTVLQTAVEYVQARASITPDIALVLGSGLGDLAAEIDGVEIAFSDIPGVASASAPTHAGSLKLGMLGGVAVAAMNGRLHIYEGHSPAEVVFPVQIMGQIMGQNIGQLGARTLVVTNAAGGLNPSYKAGDLVLIEDHLSLANLAGADPMRGPNDDALGPRFTSLNGAYSKDLLALADKAAEAAQQPRLKRGVYGLAVGPSLETPAEVRALRMLGCDLVGMSTVPEVIAARHMGLKVLAISAVANMAVDSVDDPYVTNAEDVYAAMQQIGPKMHALLAQLIPLIASQEDAS